MKTIFLAIVLLYSGYAHAFDYFGGQINYWKEKEIVKPIEKPIQEHKKIEKQKEVQQQETNKFDWSKYMDPKNKEFFKEGDYVPPEPLMELARNPSDENIKNWFVMIDTKNKLMSELQKRMGEFSARASPPLAKEEKDILERQQASITPSNVDFKRFRFRLYFESSCPHCKNMLKTLKDLENMGYYAEVRQIDNKKPDFPVPFPISQVSKNELKEKQINSWPVLFVADTSKQLIYRINGYFSTEEVLKTLSSK
ncbi:MAG: hypothetical protein KA436_08190 [Oligoflexales bacterium]|nr:hypothetical protein [Oligoflexales bacterium]